MQTETLEQKPRMSDTQLLREAEEITAKPYPGSENLEVDYYKLAEWLRKQGIKYLDQDPKLKACFIQRPTTPKVGVNEVSESAEHSDLIEGLDISEADKAMLKSRGYTLRRKLNGRDNSGEGSTRDVYYATQKLGNLEREVVVKIPRREEDVTSINALINRSKRNIDLQEAMVSGKLKHPNIVRILESLQLEDGRTFNAEDYIDGWSVRATTKRTGAMTYLPRIKSTFGPLIDAIKYSQDQGILHRDLTAVNVMIPKEGEGAVLTDWQNAAYKRDIEALAIPTRGGTGSTHPILLNALLTGEPTRASERTEIYSLGTILYEALTGDSAFDYTLEQNPNGRRININGKEFRISIKSNGKLLEQVVLEDHEKKLKEAIKKVPKELQSLIYGMLTTNPKKEISSIYAVEKQFQEATIPAEERFLDKTKRYLKAAGIGLAIGFGGIFAGYLGSIMKDAPQRTEVTLNEVLMSSSRTDAFAHGDWNQGQAIDLATRAVTNYFAVHYGIPLVSGGTNPSSGQVVVYEPGNSACIECKLGVERALATALQGSKCTKQTDPSVIMTNEIIGGMMVGETLKVLDRGYGSPVARMLKYDSNAPVRGGVLGSSEPCECTRGEMKDWLQEVKEKYPLMILGDKK